MDVNALSPSLRKNYFKITEYLDKNPQATVKEASDKTGAKWSQYYKAKQFLGRSKKSNSGRPKQTKMITLPVAQPSYSNVLVFVGDPVSVTRAAKEFMK